MQVSYQARVCFKCFTHYERLTEEEEEQPHASEEEDEDQPVDQV